MRYICTSIVATLALVGTSFAATINVPSDHATIQGAINASSNGDVIAIAAGTYNEHSLNTGDKAITIGSASGNLDVTINANEGGSVFVINSGEGSGTEIKDLVITGGNGTDLGSWAVGGGIYCDNSNPTITNCTIEGNTANDGGGIACWYNSNPTISGCMIEGNTAYYGGGISCIASNPTITGCTISGNAAYDYGGGIFCDSSNPTISGSAICGNAPNQIYGPYTASESCIEESCDTCDSDGDGLWDHDDPCPYDPDNDIDGDGVCGDVDAFPNDPNEWADSDGDGLGDNEDGQPRGACCGATGCAIANELDCESFGGTWLGEGGSCDDCPASCMGDTDGNGVVNIEDLLNMLGSWGACP